MTTPFGGQTSASQLFQKLEELRRGARLSWRALGKRVPFDHTTIYRQVTGRRPMSLCVVEMVFAECKEEILRLQAAKQGVARDRPVMEEFADLETLRALWQAEWG